MKKIDSLRIAIDEIDAQLIALLAQRIRTVAEIGKIKKQHDLAVRDEKRWKKVLDDRMYKANTLKIPSTVIEQIWTVLHEWALEIETHV